MNDKMNRAPGTQALIEQHRRFWSGDGPSLILVPTEQGALYDTERYDERFEDPQLMWESEMQRARPVIDWPTDGIAAVRPNLGVIFVPALAGQGYTVKSDQMPWPGDPLPLEKIMQARGCDIDSSHLMQLARRFYAIHRRSGEDLVCAYHPDTQGVFDIAHLLYGDEIFLAMAGSEAEQQTVFDVLEVCLDLYLRATRSVKALIGEADDGMIHGHGTAQGVYFPCGVRISEDTPTLLSPQMIERFVIPFVERSVQPFSGCFCHFCGGHPRFFERLCRCDTVLAIDLGNPELYEVEWLLQRCAESDTVLFSRLPVIDDDESCSAYVRRIGSAVRNSGARCVLRATAVPRERREAEDMLLTWRELTTR
ncbi:MAG: hypothetical protein EA384_16135 [Spirochaetaceae bacterium]|nr:MAG: hypothetical protein EA384_16135 [Spirochaetaceae bacterium]